MNAHKKVVVCINRRSNPDQPSCAMRGGVELAEMLEKSVVDRGLNIRIERFKCLGMCDLGPNIKLAPGGRFLNHADVKEIEQIVSEIEAFERS